LKLGAFATAVIIIVFDVVIFWQSVYVVYTYSFSCNGKNSFHFDLKELCHEIQPN